MMSSFLNALGQIVRETARNGAKVRTATEKRYKTLCFRDISINLKRNRQVETTKQTSMKLLQMDFFAPRQRDFWAATPRPMMACRFEMPSAAFSVDNGDKSSTVNEDGFVEFSVPIEGFGPEDIEIKVSDDGIIRLKASREEKDAKGNVVSSRRVNKSFSLPQDCDVTAIESKFNQKEGTLKIVAPRSVKQVEREKVDQDEEKIAKSVELEPEKPKESTDNEIVELASLRVDGYAPEELSVQVSEDGRYLEISGSQEDKNDGGLVVSSKQFTKTFPVPDSVNSYSVKSELSRQGVLSVTAKKGKQ